MKNARKGLFMSHFLRMSSKLLSQSSKLLSHLILILTTLEYGDDTEGVLSPLLSFCIYQELGLMTGFYLEEKVSDLGVSRSDRVLSIITCD